MTFTELARPALSVAPVALCEATVTSEGAANVVALRGEADIFTLPAVLDALARVIAEHDGPVIVDLTDTTFIDIGTVRAIGRASLFLECHDRTLTVQGPSRMAARVLTFLDLSHLIQPQPAAAA